MIKKLRTLILGLLLGGLLCQTALPPAGAASLDAAAASSSALFIENVGQFAPEARFQLWAGSHSAWLHENGITWAQPDGAIGLTFGRIPSAITPLASAASRVSYFLGQASYQDVPTARGVRYQWQQPDVTVDVRFTGGALTLTASQPPAGERVPLHVSGAPDAAWRGGRLHLSDGTTVALDAAQFAIDGVKPPTLLTRWGTALPAAVLQRLSWTLDSVASGDAVYRTYLGSSGNEELRALQVDASGNVYVTGFTELGDFPTTSGAYDRSHSGPLDAYIAKFNPAGTALLYATFLGGNSEDRGYDLRVDAAGQAVVGGWTKSADFPTTPGAYQQTLAGDWDGFVTKLNASGTALVYSTLLGGSGPDRVTALDLDSNGAPAVAGWTKSADFPTTPGAFDTTYAGQSEWDGYVMRLNSSGTAVLHSTYLGGSAGDLVRDIAFDGLNRLFVGGHTDSADFPTTLGAFDTSQNGGSDIFVTRFNVPLSAVEYSTFIGGAQDERGEGLALTSAGQVVLAGTTESADFPATANVYDPTFNGGKDAVLLRLNAAGSALDWATFIGGARSDTAQGVVLNALNQPTIVGDSSSTTLPVTSRAFDTSANGNFDAFVARFSADGRTPLYGSRIGGAGVDIGYAVAALGTAVYVGGYTDSADFPTTTGAFDRSPNGYDDVFVAKLDATPAPYTLFLSFSTDGVVAGVPFADEDILAYDSVTDSWSLYIDGSDIGLADSDINALFLYNSTQLVLSLDTPTSVPGVPGTVQASDLLLFTPTQTGNQTSGSFNMALDASDVQIDDSLSNLHAATINGNNRLAVSFGPYSVLDGVVFRQEDLLQFNPGQFGGNTVGTWSFHFDGTDVEIGSVAEQLTGAHVDRATSELYLTVNEAFSVDGAEGNSADIFVCQPVSLGNSTECRFRVFWRGGDHGAGGLAIDALTLQWLGSAAPAVDWFAEPSR